MAESIHDWAVKLGMVVDNASISAAEKLMDNFAASTVKSNERIKASNEERARAEQQAQKMREGEKIRQANLSLEDSTEERKVKLGGLFAAGAVSAQLFVTELRNINAEYRQMASADTSAVAKFGASVQAPSFEAEAARASELANLKADIIARSRIAAQQAADEQVAADNAALLSFQANSMRRLQDEQQSAQQLREMRDYYRAQEVEAARTAADQIAAAESAAADQQAARIAAYNREVRRENNDRWKESVNSAAAASDRERQIEEANAAASQQQATRTAAFDREQRRAANDRWKESVDAAGRASAADREAATQRENLDRQQATRTAAFNREQRRAANDTWKWQQDQIGARNATARAAAAEAAQIARVNNLLQQYGNHAENVAADIAFLNAALERGAISAERHGVAVAEATRRMNTMRGGAGNMSYAIGELARGAEDFITVMSITGFKMESVGMAMRGAGNNISQATNLIAGPLAGAAVGVAAILGGQLISSLMKSEEKFNTNELALRKLIDTYTAYNKIIAESLQQQSSLGAFNDRGFDIKAIESKIKESKNELPKLKNELDTREKEMKAWQLETFKSLTGNSSIEAALALVQNDLDKNGNKTNKGIVDALRKSKQDAEIKLNERLADNSLSLPAALAEYAKDMREVERAVNSFSTLQTPEGEIGVKYTSQELITVENLLRDKEKLSELESKRLDSLQKIVGAEKDIEKVDAELARLAEIRYAKQSIFSVDALEPLYEKLELAHATNEAEETSIRHIHRLNELQKEYGDLGAFGLDLANKQLAVEIELEEALKQKNSLKEQETENENKLKSLKKDLMDVDELRMLERMTAEERKAYEWAKKRAEIMITGAASPGELENIFTQQANFRMAEIDLEFKKSAPAYQTAGSSLAQTTASMNSEILRGMGQTKDKDMISELKAIREALTNPRGGIKLVEVD